LGVELRFGQNTGGQIHMSATPTKSDPLKQLAEANRLAGLELDKDLVQVKRVFTTEGVPAFDTVKWVRKDAVIVGSDGKEKFRQNDVEVPEWWNDTTVNIVVEKYFRVVNGVKENSAKQMFLRVADWLATQAIKQRVLGDNSAAIFKEELLYMFVHGMHAFNSPVWFNMGVKEKPQCSACFIQAVDDTMESIVDLAKKEVMLFKGGSGTGSNLSKLRSSYEKLSGGGKASGPVSFMKLLDSGAGVTKSGGTTRRAAKMVVMNIDHPDILEQASGEAGFITCKAAAEQIAQDLYSTGKYTAEWNKPGNVYDLVGYQNANNSVRVSNLFMECLEKGTDWVTKAVKTGAPISTYKSQELWNKIAEAAWFCGDPGIQFDTITNDWHTCRNSGRINASNPCSEYLFLDDTACNLSSLNLMCFADGKKFKVQEFIHASELATLAKELIVEGSSYPSPRIEEMSHKFRTLGLGYTNLGALLTYWGLPYDSDGGRSITAAITAVMTGAAYKMSAELARIRGPFSEYKINEGPMLEVIRKHWDAAKRLPNNIVKDWQAIVDSAYEVWKEAYELGVKYGYRNAQVTVIAPTGTISFLMGAETTGVEPMLGCVVFKKVVGEGLLVLPNGIIEPALRNLGYADATIVDILEHIRRTNTIHGAPGFEDKHGPIFAESLGDHALSPNAHVDMMVAVQPFVSGGISKTVNMPKTATPQDIANIYMRAWKGNLKCIAVYRDGCKLSQPISTEFSEQGKAQKKLAWGSRRKMPKTRDSKTHKFTIGSQEGYLTVGLYPDGTMGEFFIETSKQGSALMGFVDAWATAVSIGIQHGVPFDVLKEKFIDMKFEPSGFTDCDEIRIAKSIPDYIFRWIEHFIVNKGTEETAPVETGIMKIDSTSISSHDGPPCSKCGNMTKRAGSCYCCTNCGTTTGCS
jgi:ribonucleoside-diphosphate reductase alpha chain